ncbi:hypothetical protein ACHAWC_002845, partial [Mediolabrus comicus]
MISSSSPGAKSSSSSRPPSNNLDATSPPSSPSKKPKGQTFSLFDSSSSIKSTKKRKRRPNNNNKVDILEGLILHQEVISSQFEQQLITYIQNQCHKGRSGQLKKPTYLRSSGSRSQGNQRESLQYGGFFDFNKARPGKRGLVPDFPPILHQLVNELVTKGYIDNNIRPDSCIINQYGKGDCIPPHVDHESYARPIVTLSLLGQEDMLVGTKFDTVKSCTWKPIIGTSIPLPRRSLLLLGGNSGNIAKHCVSACKGERISITLRKQPPPDWRPSVSDLNRSGGGAKKKRK